MDSATFDDIMAEFEGTDQNGVSKNDPVVENHDDDEVVQAEDEDDFDDLDVDLDDNNDVTGDNGVDNDVGDGVDNDVDDDVDIDVDDDVDNGVDIDVDIDVDDDVDNDVGDDVDNDVDDDDDNDVDDDEFDFDIDQPAESSEQTGEHVGPAKHTDNVHVNHDIHTERIDHHLKILEKHEKKIVDLTQHVKILEETIRRIDLTVSKKIEELNRKNSNIQSQLNKLSKQKGSNKTKNEADVPAVVPADVPAVVPADVPADVPKPAKKSATNKTEVTPVDKKTKPTMIQIRKKDKLKIMKEKNIGVVTKVRGPPTEKRPRNY